MRKAFLFIVLLLLVSGGAWWKFHGAGRKAHHENTRLVTVEKGDIRDEVTAQGKIEAKDYVDVGTQVSGQIRKISVEIGDDVKAGDLLAEIDPRLYQTKIESDTARIKTLQAQLAEQEANLVLARQQQARNARLIKTNAVSRDALDQANATLAAGKARVESLKSQIEQSQSDLETDKTNLGYTTISAPMAGTVVDVPLREGQTVNASQSAPTILRIANLDVMTVRAQVAEADVMRLKPGMQVHFTTMGNMERKWQGTVRQILPTPEIVSNVVLFDVLIDSENKDRQLMLSMSTQVFFEAGAAEGVPVVPVEALNKRKPEADSGKGPAYEVKVAQEGGRPETRVIHTGLEDRVHAEVTEGLAVGDKIILPAPAAAEAPAKSGGGRGFGPRL